MKTRLLAWADSIDRPRLVGPELLDATRMSEQRGNALVTKSNRKRVLFFACVCIVSAGAIRQTFAEDDTLTRGKAEFEKALNAMRPRPSLDSTPVDFSIAGIRYRMPRNYLITMSNWAGGPQGLVTVRLSFPELQPITEVNRRCVTGPPLWGHSACEYVEFTINGPGLVSADQAFENSRDIYRNEVPIQGPFGYEEYEIGSEAARSERYRKVENGRTLLYTCQIQYVSGKRDGFCSPWGDRLPSGAELFFFFNISHLHDIAEIDKKLRNLVESLTISSQR